MMAAQERLILQKIEVIPPIFNLQKFISIFSYCYNCCIIVFLLFRKLFLHIEI